MKILYYLILCASFALSAQDGIPGAVVIKEQSSVEPQPFRDIRRQVEIADKDAKGYHLQKSLLEKEISSRLENAKIAMKSDSKLARLIFRVITKPVDDSVASLVQPSCVEESTNAKNMKNNLVISWCESVLLTSKKTDVAKDIKESVDQLVSHFIAEFN
ncbi:MAG: hypothetical protein JSS12_08245 [Verrucomicrobia bacterium]|nr:hypothetical protein [Verrucomicrobiota bacterium]